LAALSPAIAYSPRFATLQALARSGLFGAIGFKNSGLLATLKNFQK